MGKRGALLSLFSFLIVLLPLVELYAEKTSTAALDAADFSLQAGSAPIDEEERQRLLEMGYSADIQEAYLSLFLDKHYRGEILAQVERDTHLLSIRFRDLQSATQDYISKDFLEELGELQDNNGWLLIGHLESYEPYFHVRELAFYLRTPAESRDPRTIDLDRQPKRDFSEALPPDPVSAYLNLRNVYTYTSDAGSYLLDMDGAIRLNQWVGEGRFDIDSGRKRAFDYYELRLVRDFPHKLTRLTIGEGQSFRPRLLASDQIYGVKYSTEFSVQPFLVTSPISEFTFLLERDSLVTIWINGEKQRSIRLAAGPKDIRNFPLTTGFNEVTLEIQDDLGNVEFLTFNAVSGPNLLAPGRSEFAYSIGNKGRGREISGETVVSLFHRRGLSSMFTVSGEIRGEKQHKAAGAGVDFVFPWVYGSVDGAVSHSLAKVGGLARVILGRSFGEYNLTFRTDLQTKGYLTQSQDFNSSRLKFSHTASLAGPMFKNFGRLYMSISDIHKWIGDSEQRGEVRWEKLLNSRWRLEAAYLYSKYTSPHHDYRVMVSYSMLGEKIARSHSLRIRSQTQTLRNTVSGKRKQGWWVNWKGSHYREWDEGGHPIDSVNGDISYDANRFNTYYSFWVDDVGGNSSFRHNIALNSAIVYVDGVVAVGRPVRDSFALVEVHPDLGDMEMIAQRNGERNWRATQKMGAVLGDLRAYHPAEISVDSDELEFEAQNFTLLPSYRSGTRVIAGAHDEGYGPVSIVGVLIDREGNPLALKALAAIHDETVDFAPLYTFTNEDGFFQLTGVRLNTAYRLVSVEPRPHRYEIEPIEEALIGRSVEVGELIPLEE